MKAFKHIPFFRILIPFVTGILLSSLLELPLISWLVLLCILLITLCFAFFKSKPVFKISFILCTDIFLFLMAVNLVNVNRAANDKFFYGHLIKQDTINRLLVVIDEVPVEKEKFIKCGLKVLTVKKENEHKAASGRLIGYFKKSVNANQLKAGNVVLINSMLLEVEPPKNPYEFNYKNYLANKQIHYISFVDSSSFQLTQATGGISPIWLFGLKTKEYILSALKNGGLTKEAYAICAALLTGYDHDIDNTVMEAFSHSGTLHVLSVSGLHTGLIYLVLAFICDLIDRRKKYKIARFVFITICLWSFALVTGFSAPVLRAVIMFNLLGFGKIFFRNDYRNQINILFVSAFILLGYDPFLIYDIGFLLSYFAMFGILFFQPIFSNLWQPGNKISSYLWQSISASFAATLTTLPLTLFYFKQFPLWFFICNLVVVPATFIILLLAVLVVLKVSKTALIINGLIKLLIAFINLFNVSGAGYIDGIHFDWLDSLVLTLIIIIISAAFYYRSFSYLVYSIIIILFWQLNGIISSYNEKQKKLFTVYHVKKERAYSIKNKKNVISDTLTSSNFNYHVKPHFVSFNYPGVTLKTFNLIKTGAHRILILNKRNFWPADGYKQATLLVISGNFKIYEKDLAEFPNLKTIVADGTNNRYIVKHLAELCSKFGIRFHSTHYNGAYLQEL